MPLVRTLGAGSEATASAVAVLSRTITPAGDPQEFSASLLVYAMPTLTFWINQTVGALGATVQPQFAVRSLTGALVPAVDWLPLGPPVVVNPAVLIPTVLQFIQPVRLIRLAITRPAGQATTMRVILSGSL
jgi:hypothetical protein